MTPDEPAHLPPLPVDEGYETFITAHALTEGEAARLNDPVLREQVRRATADRWATEVRKGQVAKCGRSTF